MTLVYGIKLGMGQFYTINGQTFSTTLLKIGPCFVIKKTFKEIDGYNSIQVGFGFCSYKALNKSQRGYFESKNLIPFLYLNQFFVSNPNNFSIGQSLDTLAFNIFDFISIRSKTIGKGFSGVMKRYNFNKGPKTHGSKNHRQPGAIGQGTTPGRVFKGKKLAGNLGNKYRITSNLQILKINYKENLVWIKGNIAGGKHSLLLSFFTK